MRVRDEYIPTETFAEIQRRVPEVCVEVLLEHDDGVLLARRTKEPARGEWFTPGSRLYKGEKLRAAAHRVAREELGIEIEVTATLGVYDHFWETSAVEGVDTRHTVNVVFQAKPADEQVQIRTDGQHDAYRYFQRAEPTLHEYMRQYLLDAGYST